MGLRAPMLHGRRGYYGSWSAWRSERESRYRSADRQATLDGWARDSKLRQMNEARFRRDPSRWYSERLVREFTHFAYRAQI